MSKRYAGSIPIYAAGMLTVDLQVSPETLSWMRLTNESPYLLLVPTRGGMEPLPAWTDAIYEPPTYSQMQVTVIGLSTAQNAPSSSLVVTTYDAGDPAPVGTFPVALNRQTNLGNQSLPSAVTSLIVSGETPPNTIVEATPSGYASATLDMVDDGTIHFRAISNNVLTDMLTVTPGTATTYASARLNGTAEAADTANSVAGANVTGTVANATNATNATTAAAVNTGHVLLDNTPQLVLDNTALNGETAGSLKITTVNGTTGLVELHIKNPTGAHTFIDQQTGSVDIYPNGGIVCGGLIVNSSATVQNIIGLKNNGGLSGMTFFSGAATGTYTHGLATTPAYVGPTSNANGSQTMGADSYGSSTVHITSAAGQAFKAVAIAS